MLSKREQLLSECRPKRVSSYGSNPWAIVHEPTGQLVEGPTETFDFGKGLGVRPINGQIYFARKRDDLEALQALIRAAWKAAHTDCNCGECVMASVPF